MTFCLTGDFVCTDAPPLDKCASIVKTPRAAEMQTLVKQRGLKAARVTLEGMCWATADAPL